MILCIVMFVINTVTTETVNFSNTEVVAIKNNSVIRCDMDIVAGGQVKYGQDIKQREGITKVVESVPAFAVLSEDVHEKYLPVIPGSIGFGMETPAGSGRHLATPNTTVYRVTNLNDSGTGSLRYGLEEVSCPKVIIFEVSGNITLSENIIIGGWVGNDGETKGSYITIAGQTAPSPGITIKDYGIKIERTSHDILIQHIRIRPGDTSLYEGVEKEAIADCFTLVPSNAESDNIVIDHCSCSWAGDMNIQTQMSGITIQNCIISEALHNPLHPKGPHSRGLLVFAQRSEQGQNVCVTGNLFAHNMARNPSVNAGAKAVVSNNLIYNVNVQIKCDDAGKWKAFITVEKNVIKGVDRYPTARALILESRLYFGPDNLLNGESFGPDIWSNMHMPFGIVPEVCRASVPPITVPGLTLRPANEVEEWMLSNAGARPLDRDPVDIRVINDVLNGTGEIIVSQDDVGGWPDLAENTRILTIPTNPHEIQPSGYTRLEEWLHGYLAEVEDETTAPTPDDFTLQQNYPNPFNLSTTIEYTVAEPCDIQIKIYNLFGREVHVLVNEYKLAGKFSVTWDGKNAEGNELANGIYFYKLTAGKQSFSKKMLYIQSK